MVTSLAKQMAPLGDGDGHPDSSGHFESAVGGERPTLGIQKPHPRGARHRGRASPPGHMLLQPVRDSAPQPCLSPSGFLLPLLPPSPAAEGLEEWVKLLQPPHPLLPSPPPLSQERVEFVSPWRWPRNADGRLWCNRHPRPALPTCTSPQDAPAVVIPASHWMSVLIETDDVEGIFYPAAENQASSEQWGCAPGLARTWRQDLQGNSFVAGQGLQQGEAVIQLLKNASDARCDTRAGLHTGAFLSWGAEAAGLPLISALQAAGLGGAVSGFIPAPALTLCTLLLAADATDPVMRYSWDPNPLLGVGSCQKPGCVLTVLLYFPFQCMKIHLRGALLCPCLYSTCSDRFFEGTSALRDTDGHPGSSKQCFRHHPHFQAHKHLFPSHKIQPQPLGSAGTDTCSPVQGPEPVLWLAALRSLCVIAGMSQQHQHLPFT
ncbi:LOW QUALITY PROTEIN: uncharacterized protein LOC128799082 [Vidua chalybeata]|uniref:LOW QUALITY PROTEIN: uncharacterized protein LOC128799082 n=1 Tax=Vidua chalybeata TaxID=81927 RepID=UPI0023A8C4A3|nr:LOW QUALITY PROTEIN: uncharacterized protein LOC128799082 [Vidua chalybeata]